MSKNDNDVILLQKFAEFTNIVLKELNSLRGQIKGHMQKQASAERLNDKYKTSVKQAAKALWNSDLDFITGSDFDQQKFIKRAMEDPSYVVRVLEKVCNAADVSLIGKPARVAPVTNKQAAIQDPVYAKAFGLNRQRQQEEIIDWD